MITSWSYAAACVRGVSHAAAGIPCQDATAQRVHLGADGSEILILVVSDGAGSAAYSEFGAAAACDSLCEGVAAWYDAFGTGALPTKDAACGWITEFVVPSIRDRARDRGVEIGELSCTLLAAVLHSDWTACLQVGDGAVVVEDSFGLYPVFWPHCGEYANMTTFVTDEDVGERFEFVLIESPIQQIALFTDGIQTLALHFATRTAHIPFFAPLFERLGFEEPGARTEIAQLLELFLDSPRVNERTEDDKTLVIASRVEGLLTPINEEMPIEIGTPTLPRSDDFIAQFGER